MEVMKRVAFIDRCIDGPDDGESLLDRIRFEENRKIIDRLGKTYSLTTYHELSDRTVRKMKEDCLVLGDYDAVITHVPCNEQIMEMANMMRQRATASENEIQSMLDKTYDDSLRDIKQISLELPRARIIAYTGASPTIVTDETLHGCGVRLVIRKWTPLSDNQLEENSQQIIKWIDGEIAPAGKTGKEYVQEVIDRG